MFHGLFGTRDEMALENCLPQQETTRAFFGEFVERLLAAGIAIHPLEEALAPASTKNSCCVITFDDGYYNNVHAVEILERLNCTATFFISTGHVQEQKAFWWDVIFRNARRQGKSDDGILRLIRSLHSLSAEEVEERVRQWYGSKALSPVSDIDRPFLVAELRDFARSRAVRLGNHTAHHAILTNYDEGGMHRQIMDAQRFLASVTGSAPRAIAYPNGHCDERVVRVARSLGLDFGLTSRPGLNRAGADPMRLSRTLVWGRVAPGMQAGALKRFRLLGT